MASPIFHNVAAGSDEYYKLKIGVPSASQFHNIVTPGGKPTTGDRRRKYMYRLIAERVFQQSFDDRFENYWTKRGKELEPQAVCEFEEKYGPTSAGGFVTSHNKKVGCSPDRIVISGNARECVEIKCTSPWQHIEYVLDGPGTNYKPQVQGQLLIGGFACAHFFAYHPGAPSVHIVTLQDEEFIKVLQKELVIFCNELDDETARARKAGEYKLAETLRMIVGGNDDPSGVL